jgi:hypothetical protein
VVDSSDDTEYHCSLEIAGAEGISRLVTRGRRGPAPEWGEAFAVPLSALLPSGSRPTSHYSERSTEVQQQQQQPQQPPQGAAKQLPERQQQRLGMLSVRLATRKQLRSDAALATGELPLDGLAACLVPGAAPLTQSVMLQPASSKPSRGAQGRAGAADAVLLRLAVVTAVDVPPGLRGAAATTYSAGRGCCASALSAVGAASLHTREGVLLEVPPLQHLRLVLHAATGLEQLRMEPAAALTAATQASPEPAAGGGCGGGGAAGDGHSSGSGAAGEPGGLLALGSSWLQNSGKGAKLAGVVAAAWAAKRGGGQGAGTPSPEEQRQPHPEAATGPPQGAAEASPGQPLGESEDAVSELRTLPPPPVGADGSAPAQAAAVAPAGPARPWMQGVDGGQEVQQGGPGGGRGKSRHRPVGSIEREVLMGLLEGGPGPWVCMYVNA